MSYPLQNVQAQDVEDQLYLWPTDLNINRDHLIKDYIPTKFEVFLDKVFLSYR